MEFSEILTVIGTIMDEVRAKEALEGNELYPEMWTGLGFEESVEVAKEFSKLQRILHQERCEAAGEAQILCGCGASAEDTFGNLFEELLDQFICLKRLLEVSRVKLDAEELREFVRHYEGYKMARARGKTAEHPTLSIHRGV